MRILVALETAAEFVVRFAFVALAAERDDLPDCRRVTLVAVLALRNHFVLLLVTGYAEQRFVLCLAGNKLVICFCVTGSTLLGRGVSSVSNSFRHMCLVTLLAVAGTLIGRVSLVALRALRDFAVDIVAE